MSVRQHRPRWVAWVWAALVALPAPALAASLSPAVQAAVTTGRIWLEPLRGAPTGSIARRARFFVALPPAQVWAALADCSQLDQFMEGIDKSRRTVRGSRVLCYQRTDMPLFFDDLWAELQVFDSKPAADVFVRKWRLVRGTYARHEGYWRMEPWGTGTLVSYQVNAKPDTGVPDTFIDDNQDDSVRDALASLRTRAMRLARR